MTQEKVLGNSELSKAETVSRKEKPGTPTSSRGHLQKVKEEHADRRLPVK